ADQIYWFGLSSTDDKVSIPSEQIPDPILQPTSDLIVGQCIEEEIIRVLRTMSEQKLIRSSSSKLSLTSKRKENEKLDKIFQCQNYTKSYLGDKQTDNTTKYEQHQK